VQRATVHEVHPEEEALSAGKDASRDDIDFWVERRASRTA
jgi:hypothetical protein